MQSEDGSSTSAADGEQPSGGSIVTAVAGPTRSPWLVWTIIATFAAVATPLEPFSWRGRLATAAVGLAVVAVAVARGQLRHRSIDASGPALGGARTLSAFVWLVLLGALAGYQLALFFSEPRGFYPTLSSLINLLLEPYPVRATAFFGWIWIGWYLVARR